MCCTAFCTASSATIFATAIVATAILAARIVAIPMIVAVVARIAGVRVYGAVEVRRRHLKVMALCDLLGVPIFTNLDN